MLFDRERIDNDDALYLQYWSEFRSYYPHHGIQFRNMTIDHIHPRSKGGTDAPENLQLLCGACNSMKGDRSQTYLIGRLQEEGILR